MSKTGQQLNRAAQILRSPLVTEKSAGLQERSAGPVYAFVVDARATKPEIKSVVKRLYKVVPQKIGIIKVKAKRFTYRGRAGERAGYKKALVYLKRGEKLELA